MTDAREILERRARDLARPFVATATADVVEVVEFSIAGEQYAIDAREVDAAFALKSLTPLPGAVLPLAGVTIWRGVLVNVLDVRARLGLSAGALNDLRMVLLLAHPTVRTGFLVDAITGARSRSREEFIKGETSGSPEGLTRGMTRDAVTLIDAAQVSHNRNGGTST